MKELDVLENFLRKLYEAQSAKGPYVLVEIAEALTHDLDSASASLDDLRNEIHGLQDEIKELNTEIGRMEIEHAS